jgi:endo-1,4-beta-xylanase
LATGHEKFIGNVINFNIPASFDAYWNQVTPENAGKWGSVEGSRDVYGWGGADLAYNYARQRGLPFKFHTLIWGNQQPGWITQLSPAEQAEEIEEWIRLVGERYPEMDFVDVVNEPLPGHAPAGYRNAIGGAGATGWDWVIWSFEKARQYLPNAKLLVNEYNLLNSDSNTNTTIQIVNLLKQRNLIDGIGIQCHRFEVESPSVNALRANLDRLAATGLPIYISEFDIGNLGNTGTPNDAQQLQIYQRVFPVLWEHPGVKGITFWGYIQGAIWQETAFLVRTDGTERPALQWLRQYLSSGNFRSFQSGNWNDANSWEWNNGTEWVHPAPNAPRVTTNPIVIQNGHTITVTADDSVDQLTIVSDGALVINQDVTFSIGNGSGDDLTVFGTVSNLGTLTKDESATIRFAEGGRYAHERDGGAIPVATWGAGSTCEIKGVTGSVPSNAAQDFYNFTWNCPSQSSNLNVGWQNGTTIAGTLTVTSSNWNHASNSSPAYQFRLFGGPGSCTINNIVVNGYNAVLTAQGSGYADTVTVTGNITLSNGGMLSLSNNSGGVTTYYVNGNFTVVDSAYIGKSNSANLSKFIFRRSGTQNLVLPSSGVTFFGAPSIVVGSGATLNMGTSAFGGTGSFQVEPGATLESGHVDGINGNVRCTGANGGGNAFSKSASYAFSGSAAQITGSALPDTVAGLLINNSAGLTLSNPLTVNGTLDMRAGALFVVAPSGAGRTQTGEGSNHPRSLFDPQGGMPEGITTNLSLGGNLLTYGPEGTLRYSGTAAQSTSDTEFPTSNGPKHLMIANTTSSGVTLHASRLISGNLEVGGRLRLNANTMTAASATSTGLTRYVVTGNNGVLRLTSVGASEKLFPMGTSGYAPVWISNSGAADTVGITVIDDASPPPAGGRVRVQWIMSEETEGGSDYTLRFGWVSTLEDAGFRGNRAANARIFDLTDTSEVGTGAYATQFSLQPYTVSRGGITKLGPLAVGGFRGTTGVAEDGNDLPAVFSLSQNYPNPFNPSTNIRYSLPKSTHTTVTIYDMRGTKVRTLANSLQNAGVHSVVWDGRDDQTKPVASGVYFYRLEAGDLKMQKKMVLLQ